MKKAQRSLTPQEQLDNVHDSLADDVFDAALDVDESSKERGVSIVRTALNEALQRQDSGSDGSSKKDWAKQMKNEGTGFKRP